MKEAAIRRLVVSAAPAATGGTIRLGSVRPSPDCFISGDHPRVRSHPPPRRGRRYARLLAVTGGLRIEDRQCRQTYWHGHPAVVEIHTVL